MFTATAQQHFKLQTNHPLSIQGWLSDALPARSASCPSDGMFSPLPKLLTSRPCKANISLPRLNGVAQFQQLNHPHQRKCFQNAQNKPFARHPPELAIGHDGGNHLMPQRPLTPCIKLLVTNWQMQKKQKPDPASDSWVLVIALEAD